MHAQVKFISHNILTYLDLKSNLKIILAGKFVCHSASSTLYYYITRVSIIGWLKSLILKATYELYLCLAKFYFDSSRSDSTLLTINPWWLRAQRHLSSNLYMDGLNPTSSKTFLKFSSFE